MGLLLLLSICEFLFSYRIKILLQIKSYTNLLIWINSKEGIGLSAEVYNGDEDYDGPLTN